MKRNRSIPPTRVIPVLVYPDVREAVVWLTAAFGFTERTRIGESHRAQMSIGVDAAMIVADVGRDRQPPQPGTVTHVMKVRVEDVDAYFARARAHGARVIEAPIDREYGERECTLEDLAGHRWEFSETLRDVAPEEFGCETVAPWPEGPLAWGYAEAMDPYPSKSDLDALATQFGLKSSRGLQDLAARRRAGAGDDELIHLLTQPDWGGLSEEQATALVAQLSRRA